MTASVATVSLEALTRFYVQNHNLADRASKTDIVRVIDRACGLHAQLPMTPYYSLWNRVVNFKPQMLDELMYSKKTLVKTWFMRGTLHIIPSQNLPLYNSALKRMWFEHHGRYMNKPDWPSRKERESRLYPKIKEALTEKPLSRKELCNRVRFLLANEAQPYERLFSAWGGIMKETGYMGLTVHAEPCKRESYFARLDQWLNGIDLSRISEREAKHQLFKKYLHGYGPTSAQDFACWSGMLISEARQIIEETDGIEQVQLEGSRSELWILKEDSRALDRIDLEAEVPPRLLPKYDSYLMGHRNRARIIRDEMLKKVYRPVVGEVAATVLVNGRIVGTWTSRRKKKVFEILVKPLEKLPERAFARLKPVANELAQFVGVEEAKITLG